jgi:hypothetical protein
VAVLLKAKAEEARSHGIISRAPRAFTRVCGREVEEGAAEVALNGHGKQWWCIHIALRSRPTRQPNHRRYLINSLVVLGENSYCTCDRAEVFVRNFYFDMGKYHPNFYIQEVHIVFLLDYSQHLTKRITKIEPKPPN